MEQKQFHELFKEYADLKGMSASRLAEASGVPERYIEAFLGGDYSRLPAAPYVRGYLKKIGPVMSVDGEELWRAYKEEQTLKSSGAADQMPSNRFALKKMNRTWLVGALLAAAILVYLGVRIDDVIGMPTLVVENPSLSETTVTEESLVFRGVVSPGDKLTLNGEEVPADTEGRFEKEVSLDPGVLNVFTFVARRSLGRERTVVRRIIYQPASP
ncbi:MAG: helix-turn-helix domain-containing protein [bacterium]|nr:helix-turn-helix domain-containing protein [bacterium]